MTQRELPPGPAFVLATRLPRGIGDLMRWENWKEQNVPLGYIWRPATDCTPAGWVRPMGNPDNRKAAGARPRRLTEALKMRHKAMIMMGGAIAMAALAPPIEAADRCL